MFFPNLTCIIEKQEYSFSIFNYEEQKSKEIWLNKNNKESIHRNELRESVWVMK